MRIESSQQMFQHIENGGNLKLNGEGRLETQSAAGRFFQKIGDAFRSLSASGRAAIETRTARLHEAMADMVRRDALVNPAQTDIPNPVADPVYNRQAIIEKIDEAEQQRAAVVVFPELCITGYTCGDLFLMEPLLEIGRASCRERVSFAV